MPTQQLTDATVKRLALPATGSTIVYDGKMGGFGVRLTANGARSYILRYRTRGSMRDRSFTIGDAGDWRTSEARAEAKRLKQIVDQGGDPLGELQAERKAPTMTELFERFAAEHLPRVGESTRLDYKRLIKNHMAGFFGEHTKVADVRFGDIDRLHRKLTRARLVRSLPIASSRCSRRCLICQSDGRCARAIQFGASAGTMKDSARDT